MEFFKGGQNTEKIKLEKVPRKKKSEDEGKREEKESCKGTEKLQKET